MSINFTMSDEQRKLQAEVRDFAQNVLQPHIGPADREPDPLKAFALTQEPYIEAYKRGYAMSTLPPEYSASGLSCLDFTIAVEEISAVDPGFGTTILVNGLGLLPVVWYGSDEQKDKWLRAATSDPTGKFLAAWVASEPPGPNSGTANFDIDSPRPAGVGLTAERRGDVFILNGRKLWPSAGGWDGKGTDLQTVICRTNSEVGGTKGLSAIVVERGTPGITYNFIDKDAQRTHISGEVIFENVEVPAANLLPGADGNGDLVINRNFAWSGPAAAAAAVGVARTAYEMALEFAKNNSAGSLGPIMRFQNVGYVLGDVAAKIEMARVFYLRGADYLDKHDRRAELIGAQTKVQVTEMMMDVVFKCMQIVGVNSMRKDNGFGRLLREASLLPVYDGGNMGMQRRRIHGIMAHPDFNARAIMEDATVTFTKEMESIGTIQ